MPTSCCVIGCTSRGGSENNLAFHRIPKNGEKREKWIAAIRRGNWTPTESSRVCGRHFVTGRKNDDKLHVDYVPSLHMGYMSSKIVSTDARYHRQKNRAEKVEEQGQRTSAANILLEISQSQPVSETMNDETHNIHDNCLKTITELNTQNKQLLQEIQCLQEERDKLKQGIQSARFGVHSLKDNDTLTSMYTGVPSYAVFMWILNHVESVLPEKQNLTPGNVLLIVLMKIRTNLLNFDLAQRFGVSETVISSVINLSLPQLAAKLCFFVHWPSKEDTIRTTPKIVKDNFRNCRCIVDCTEIYIDRPGNLTARASTWSNYKQNNTIKLLVAINPCGAITFLSRAFGGRVSDKVITQRSGFLDLVEHGDVVLADRGFLISDELACRGATLKIPAFTRGKAQLSQEDIEKTRQLARVRIHVERAIGRIKAFRILSSVMPMHMVPHTDSVMVIVASICNLQPSLIS